MAISRGPLALPLLALLNGLALQLLYFAMPFNGPLVDWLPALGLLALAGELIFLRHREPCGRRWPWALLAALLGQLQALSLQLSQLGRVLGWDFLASARPFLVAQLGEQLPALLLRAAVALLLSGAFFIIVLALAAPKPQRLNNPKP